MNPNPVMEVTRKGKVSYYNHAALKHFPDIIKKGSAHPILKGIFKEHDKIENEVMVDGKWYLRPSYFVRGKEAKRIYCIDITERKKTEEELQKSERHRIIGTLISGIAHEVRNPLVSVKGFFQLLNDKGTKEKDKQEIAGLAVNEIKRMESLLDSLLSFARPSKTAAIDSDIHKLIHDSIALIEHDASKRKIKIKTRLDADPPHLLVDPKQIQQVLLNLSMNALDAMKNGGILRISMSYLKDQNMICVTFRDSGCGIKKENMPKLFEPFFTTKASGTGLGLSICQQIIESYNGKISVESKEKEGTSVHIRLPACGY